MSYRKYYLYKQQVSYDDGETWEDVSPLVTTPSGDSIGEYATLEECESNIQYRWVVVSGGYECSGTTKMTQEKKQQSTDGGETWTDVIPTETRAALPVIEYNSPDCGYEVCNCDSFVFEGVEETSTASIILSLHNGGSTSLNLGVFEIFTSESSVQVPVNYQIAAGETKDVLVADYSGNEGNTVVRVEGTISDISHCFTFICPSNYCDLIDGDTLTVEVASIISCS
jgi:hypothetical protein